MQLSILQAWQLSLLVTEEEWNEMQHCLLKEVSLSVHRVPWLLGAPTLYQHSLALFVKFIISVQTPSVILILSVNGKELQDKEILFGRWTKWFLILTTAVLLVVCLWWCNIAGVLKHLLGFMLTVYRSHEEKLHTPTLLYFVGIPHLSSFAASSSPPAADMMPVSDTDMPLLPYGFLLGASALVCLTFCCWR